MSLWCLSQNSTLILLFTYVRPLQLFFNTNCVICVSDLIEFLPMWHLYNFNCELIQEFYGCSYCLALPILCAYLFTRGQHRTGNEYSDKPTPVSSSLLPTGVAQQSEVPGRPRLDAFSSVCLFVCQHDNLRHTSACKRLPPCHAVSEERPDRRVSQLSIIISA